MNVLACVDGQGNPAALCDGAAWAARELAASLTFLHVIDRHPEKAQQVDFSGQIGLGAQESLLAELAELDARRSVLAQEHGRQILDGMRQRAQATGVPAVHALQRHGELVETVTGMEDGVNLIIMGRHAHQSWAGRHFDHHIERMLRAVRRPVLVLDQTRFQPPRSFLLAYDGSEAAKAILAQVATIALLKGRLCHLVHVGDASSAMQSELERAAQALRAQGSQVEAAIVSGQEVEAALGDYIAQREVHMLVMGAHGHSRVRRLLLGSTTAALLRTSTVPALVLR